MHPIFYRKEKNYFTNALKVSNDCGGQWVISPAMGKQILNLKQKEGISSQEEN